MKNVHEARERTDRCLIIFIFINTDSTELNRFELLVFQVLLSDGLVAEGRSLWKQSFTVELTLFE